MTKTISEMNSTYQNP